MPRKSGRRTIYRSSKTGRIVTKSAAKRSPGTHEKESVRRGTRRGGRKK